MRIAFIIVASAIGLLIFYIYPLFAILRGGRIFLTISVCWVLGFIYVLTLCLGIPLFVHSFDRNLSNEMLRGWVPDGMAVGACLVIGWLPPLIGAMVGKLTNGFLARRHPMVLDRIRNIGKK